MNAEELLKIMKRICKKQSTCGKCPLLKICFITRPNAESFDIEELLDIVETWNRKHPMKTNGEAIVDYIRKITQDTSRTTGNYTMIAESDPIVIYIPRVVWEEECMNDD